ncbi:MAG TPA: DUF1684 domain-containing protein [Actinomycetota bacterium]|nr:DUF1684 domain-containing protein [Actinomycetota bacterium]
MTGPDAAEVLDLLDWRRRIAELYARVRVENDPARGWTLWRETRDRMFRTHPQSPLATQARASFAGLAYFDYDPRWRATATLRPGDALHLEIPTSGEDPMAIERVGVLTLEVAGAAVELEAYWLTSYGGGLFVPFRDATAGNTTYGAGRYLLDTVKGADLGAENGAVVLDFNFAYNPSCSYDPAWVCPLAPPANRLDIAIEAGERL